MPRFLCVWQRQHQKERELADFCVPEIDRALQLLSQACSEPCEQYSLADAPESRALSLKPESLLRWINLQQEELLHSVVKLCTLLSVVIEVCMPLH